MSIKQNKPTTEISGLLNSVDHYSEYHEQLSVEPTATNHLLTTNEPVNKTDPAEISTLENIPNQAAVTKSPKRRVASQISATAFPEFLEKQLARYPKNRRRPVNKTVLDSQYFELIYNVNTKTLAIQKKNDLVYSAIPYDTARSYIEKAALLFIVDPEKSRSFIETHQAVLEEYLSQSISTLERREVIKTDQAVHQAYQQIYDNPLFAIQVMGRLLQHDERGALSANLPGKFLYEENRKTGISEYLYEYLAFLVKLRNELNIGLVENELKFLSENTQLTLANEGESTHLLPENQIADNSLSPLNNILNLKPDVTNKPLLKSEYGPELANLRKHYHAHSVDPKTLAPLFENPLPIENNNQLNVISDVHADTGTLPFANSNFNILVGDISDSKVRDDKVKGIYVIGHHELFDVLPAAPDQTTPEWQKWQSFQQYQWFQLLAQNPEEAWPLLPLGNHAFYRSVKSELALRFPKMTILNNESFIKDDVRYIGLTIPVILVKRKKALQDFIYSELKRLLAADHEIPTVIISHAPLFNELNMLSSKSSGYYQEYNCENSGIRQLFKNFNIIGAIHGHHHIPASFGRSKQVQFAGKDLFLVCSAYSKLNTGFELKELLKLISF